MVIDIKRTVIKTHLRRMITLIVFVLLILVLLFTGILKNGYLGMNKLQWSLVVTLLYVITIIVESLLDMNYIYFSDRDELIILRYFSMSIFSKKKNSIEIPKKDFGGYTLRSSLAGLKHSIVLLHSIKGKNAKYPPVSLSSLNKKQLKQIILALDKYK